MIFRANLSYSTQKNPATRLRGPIQGYNNDAKIDTDESVFYLIVWDHIFSG